MSHSMLYCHRSLPAATTSLRSMRRSTSSPTVVWACAAKKVTLNNFKALYPAQGARVWAITEGLSAFLDQVENSPRLQRIAHEDIQNMMRIEGPPKDLQKTNVRIPSDLYHRFNNVFPEFGATTWFFRKFLDSLVEYMIEHKIDMNQLIDVSVRNMLRESSTPKVEL